MSKSSVSPEPNAAVIWIDSVPLIKAETRKYMAAIRKLNEARDRLELHTKSDEPKYNHWIHTEFSDQLENIRKLHHRYFELEGIIASVEAYMRDTGASVFEAYEAYLEAKEMAELVKQMEAEMGEEKARRSKPEDDADSEAYEEFQSSERGREQQREAPSMKKAGRGKSTADESSIKQIYRDLARRLHPDINGNLSAHEKELWFEVQQAYDDRDLARLEALQAMVEREAEEGDESRVEKVQSLGRLKAMLKNLARKLKATQRSLTKAKKSLAWDFHKVKADPRKMSKLKIDITIEFAQVEEGLGSDVRRFEKQISRWERAVKRKQSRGLDGYEDTNERGRGRDPGRGRRW